MTKIKDRADEGIESAASTSKGYVDSAKDSAKQAVESGTSAAQRVVDKVSENAGAAAEQGKKIVSQVSHAAAETGERVQKWAGDAYDVSREEIQYAYDATAQQLQDYSKELTHLVRKYPLQSLLVGFTAGLLVSRAMRS